LDSYKVKSRRRFKCVACAAQYSPTAGTIFHSRKLSFTDLLAALCIVANAAKGLSALQLSRDLDVQAKTLIMHLTPHGTKSSPDAATAEAVAGAPGEITPEMIEAGLVEFLAFDDRFDLEEDAVAKIFRAMFRLLPNDRSSSQ